MMMITPEESFQTHSQDKVDASVQQNDQPSSLPNNPYGLSTHNQALAHLYNLPDADIAGAHSGYENPEKGNYVQRVEVATLEHLAKTNYGERIQDLIRSEMRYRAERVFEQRDLPHAQLDVFIETEYPHVIHQIFERIARERQRIKECQRIQEQAEEKRRDKLSDIAYANATEVRGGRNGIHSAAQQLAKLER